MLSVSRRCRVAWTAALLLALVTTPALAQAPASPAGPPAAVAVSPSPSRPWKRAHRSCSIRSPGASTAARSTSRSTCVPGASRWLDAWNVEVVGTPTVRPRRHGGRRARQPPRPGGQRRHAAPRGQSPAAQDPRREPPLRGGQGNHRGQLPRPRHLETDRLGVPGSRQVGAAQARVPYRHPIGLARRMSWARRVWPRLRRAARPHLLRRPRRLRRLVASSLHRPRQRGANPRLGVRGVRRPPLEPRQDGRVPDRLAADERHACARRDRRGPLPAGSGGPAGAVRGRRAGRRRDRERRHRLRREPLHLLARRAEERRVPGRIAHRRHARGDDLRRRPRRST